MPLIKIHAYFNILFGWMNQTLLGKQVNKQKAIIYLNLQYISMDIPFCLRQFLYRSFDLLTISMMLV